MAIPPPATRFILYARRSQEREERQVQSIDDQLARARQLAQSQGLLIHEEITESRSAKEPGQRPSFAGMLRLIEQGRADGILAWHPDRLSRNELDAAQITYLVRKGRLHLQFVNYSFVNSPEGIMMLQMALSQSQYYSSKLAVDVVRGMTSKMEKGWCPFRAPEGYRNDAETRTVTADPDRFPLIRLAWERLLTGAYTVPDVVRLLNEEWGYTTRPSKGVKPSVNRRGGGPLSLPSAYKLFHNPYYTGRFAVSGVTYPGQHPPMVSVAEFDQVQRHLARHGTRRPRKNEFAYTGLIRCSRCGCQVTAERQRGRYKPGPYVYYHCTNRRGVCCKVGIREEALEAQIRQLLSEITLERDVAEYAMAAVARWQYSQTDAPSAVQAQQQTSLAEAERQLQALLDLKLRDMVPDALFSHKQAELSARVVTLSQAQAQSAREGEEAQGSALRALGFMADAQGSFLVGTEAEKREIARGLGLHYTFDRGQVTIERHPALMPHLIQRYVRESGYSSENTPVARRESVQDTKTALLTGRFEQAGSGSGSTKKAALAAAFSSGGPQESLAERLWEFFHVNPRFAGAPCLLQRKHGFEADT